MSSIYGSMMKNILLTSLIGDTIHSRHQNKREIA